MSHRKMTPRGQMSSSGSGPAIMMMPPHIREVFMPNPPLKHIPKVKNKRKNKWIGMADYMIQFENAKKPPDRKKNLTPSEIKKERIKQKKEHNDDVVLKPLIEQYKRQQQTSQGEFNGMNCYNTLFVGRLAFEVTERKLLREFETFGPIKDLKLIKNDGSNNNNNDDDDSKTNKSPPPTSSKSSRGYAFIEYEHEEDMKRAYRAADGMTIEGKPIVVDVERGHTVPNWLPRRLGGGLGGTRLGGKEKNYTAPGRFDPSRPENSRPPPASMGMERGGGGPQPPMGRGGGPYGGGPPPSPHWMGRGGGGRDRDRGPPRGGGPSPPPYHRSGSGGGRDWDRDRGGYGDRDRGRYGGGDRDRDRDRDRGRYGDRDRDRRKRSRSPDDRHRHHSRRRY